MKEITITDEKRTYQMAVKLGVVTAIIFLIYELLMHFMGNDQQEGFRFLKYIFLAIIIGYGRMQVNKWIPPKLTFNRGIVFGLLLSGTAAITLIPVNLVLYFINPRMVVSDTFALEKNFLDVFLNSMGNVLIYLALGFFISLLWSLFFEMRQEKNSGEWLVVSG